jgi:putative nucleotidyltransferase with HDIG domain
MRAQPLKLKLYLISIYAVTFISLCFFINNNYKTIHLPNILFLIFFGALMGVTESFTVLFRNISFSTSFAVTIVSYILYGPGTAIIVALIGLSVSVVKDEGKYLHVFSMPLYKTLFNYCMFLLPILYGDYIFIKLGGSYGGIGINNNIFPIIVFCITFFLMNVLFFSVLSSLISNRGLLYNVISNLKLGVLNFFAMAPLGILSVYMYKISYLAFLLFLFPIILARFTFSLYIEAKSKYINTVDVIMHAMEARDKYTEGHSKRVAELACDIARELKFNEGRIENLNVASLLHDVGKISIDDNILNKPGKLTNEEYNTIKQHPQIGYNILTDMKGSDYVKTIVKYHHERFDGKGYPEGKKSDELDLDVFIVQLADSIDAMSTDRPYRNALNEKEIIGEIKNNIGTQFHPAVVEAYFKVMNRQQQSQMRGGK